MPVYKDECVYTFDTPESPLGIDVCLKCFIATSPHPQHNFTDAHVKQTGHSAFLNVRKVPRETSGEPETLTKLEIRAETDADKFDLVTAFKALDTSLSEKDFAHEIETVLTADSYAKAQEVMAWELEIEPCVHVVMLETAAIEPSVEHRRLDKCSKCDLTSNLWICLWCGEVSCGRAQFGGGGGNDHALEHFGATEHPLAVKLGSITPEGKADVYCYACDNEVTDPQLAEHLQRWGIDVAKRSKTEKSLVELQLEQNMKWDFGGSADELVHGPGLTGLKNLGNTCYLNSCMQSFFALDKFKGLFPANSPEEIASEREKYLDPAQDAWTQLRKVQDGLHSGRYNVVAPDMIKALFGKGHSDFSTMQQQDAFEYWGHMLDKITKAATTKIDRDPVAEVLGFATERRVECMQCHAVRYTEEAQQSLSLNVPIEEIGNDEYRPIGIEEMLEGFVAPETIEGYACPGCHKTTTAVSTTGFKTFPHVLVINARRFRVVNWVPEKVNVPVIVPEVGISLEEYEGSGSQPDELIVKDKGFVPDPSALEMLVGAGFSRDRCLSALEAANNDAEQAMENLLNPKFEGPTEAIGNSELSSESVTSLELMGFPRPLAQAALRANKGSIEASVEWLFSGHTEADAPPPEATPVKKSTPIDFGLKTPGTRYRLSSVICHKGTSVHVGHYVSAIERDGFWYLYNDERVSKGADAAELQQYAYMYVFERVD